MENHNILLAMFLIFGLIGAIRVNEPVGSDDFFMHINVNNEGSKDLDGLRVRVLFYDLDLIFQTNPFDLDNGDSTGKLIFWDAPYVAPGTYLVRITVSNDDFREVKHRFVTIA